MQTAAASAILVSAFVTSASAGVDVSITGDGFGATQIRVISENGTSWTKIEDSGIVLPVKIGLGMTDFNIQDYTVRQSGQPHNEHIGYQNYLSGDHLPIRLDFVAAYMGSTNHLSAEHRQQILAMCNSKLNTGKGIQETHNLFTGVGVELDARFIHKLDHAVLRSGSGTVTVPVKCEGRRKPADDVTAAVPDFKVKGVNLRFMTTAGYPTAPNPGTRCQLTHAKVRVETTKAGPVKFNLWTKVGNEPAQREFVEAWSKFVGPGKHEATFLKAIPVSKTTEVQAMVEETTNPIGLSTGWKSVTVDCTGAGGGGLAGTPGTSNPDGLPKFPVPPRRVIGDPTQGTITGKPDPTHGVPSAPNRTWQVKTAPLPTSSAVAAKDRFYVRKPHVN
jgi:hypothetical protein